MRSSVLTTTPPKTPRLDLHRRVKPRAIAPRSTGATTVTPMSVDARPTGNANGSGGAGSAASAAAAAAAASADKAVAAAHNNTGPMGPLDSFKRSASFWARAGAIYASYKGAQARAALMRLAGASAAAVDDAVWKGQHEWAGRAMFELAIDLRGFYLKAGQFIGARADFVPEAICRQLSVLQDRVPPMDAARAAAVLRAELGVNDLAEVFDEIDLEDPLGSASISQVHRARLRRFTPRQLAAAKRAAKTGQARRVALADGDTAWSVCNAAGLSLAELAAANPGVDLDTLQAGDEVLVPDVLGLGAFASSNGNGSVSPGSEAAAASSSSSSAVALLGDRHTASRTSSSASTSASSSSSSSRKKKKGGRGGGGGFVDDFLRGFGDDGGTGAGSRASAGWQSSSSSSSSDTSSDSGGAAIIDHAAAALVTSTTTSSSPNSSGGFMGLGRLVNAVSRGLIGGRDNAAAAAAAEDERPIASAAAAAVAHAVAVGSAPPGGLVAVKVQYPDALRVMAEDLVNLRAISAFLSKTEIKFDLVSAVDELQKQIHLEFDFMREARVMDAIASHLAPIRARVAVPRSIPGLVTRRVMAMTFMEGTPLTALADRVAHLPQWQRERAARIILANISEAYGRMVLGEGLFQADGHPGNILVRPGGAIALLDYGQSKQLPPGERAALARLIGALHRGDTADIDAALTGLGVVTSKDDRGARREMAYGMFDTRGTVDPFDPSSPIKRVAITTFPPDLFFVLRVVQLLRGIAQGMGVTDFSSADQWAPLAVAALREEARRADARRRRGGPQPPQRQRWRAPLPSLASLASPLRLNA